MSVPSLFTLSCKKVARYMKSGKYHEVDFKFSTKISEQLLKELDVKETSFWSEEQALSISQKLVLTRVDLRKRSGVNRADMVFLGNQDHLVSLELGAFRCQPGCTEEFIEQLKSCVSVQSRKSLRHFGLATGDYNTAHFVPKLFRLFPNLTSLNLHDCRINIFGLIAIHNNYPNLTQLDICTDRLFNIQGISRLRHLEHLSVGCSRYEGYHGLEELCKMSSLRVLVIFDPEDKRDSRLFEELFEFIAPGSFPNLEVLDLSGNVVTLRKYQHIVKALPRLRRVILLDTPLDLQNLNESLEGPRVLNCASFALLRESFHFLKGRGDRIRNMLYHVLRHPQCSILETDDPNLKNSFIRDICTMLIGLSTRDESSVSIWKVCCQTLKVLVSHTDNWNLTLREVRALISIYFAFKNHFSEAFWRTLEIHYIMWKVMRDMCLNDSLAEYANRSVVLEAIRALGDARIQPRAVSYVLKFFKAGFECYPREYTRFLADVRRVAIESLAFCRNYVRFNLIERFFFDMNLRPTDAKAKLAHLKILKLVVLNERQITGEYCGSHVVAHLLSYITPGPQTLIGHYAFAILWILETDHGFANPRQSEEFEKLKRRKPLVGKIVWEIIDSPEEIELIYWAPPDETVLS